MTPFGKIVCAGAFVALPLLALAVHLTGALALGVIFFGVLRATSKRGFFGEPI